MTIEPLAEQLDHLEASWRQADARCEEAVDDSEPAPRLLDVMMHQTRFRARHATWIAWEHAPSPSLRVALVREELWTPREAIGSCARMGATHCGHLIELLPLLPDGLVPELVDHTRGESWAPSPADSHVGVWVAGAAGGDSFMWRLCARLMRMGHVAQGLDVFARIQDVGARTSALEAIEGHLDERRWMQARAESLALGRREDPIRRHYALCGLSRLYPPHQARELVNEAIRGLPEGHDWIHLPGGLMMMLLSEPVAQALDRDGLRHELEELAQTQGQNFADGLRMRLYDREDDERGASAESRALSALAALEQARSGGDLLPLCGIDADALPRVHIPQALRLVIDAARAYPDNPHPPLTLLRLAARTDDADATAEVQRSLEEIVLSVPWSRYSDPYPIWCHAEFDRLPAQLRERVLTRAIVDSRGSPVNWFVAQLRALALVANEVERTPLLHLLATAPEAPVDEYVRVIGALGEAAPAPTRAVAVHASEQASMIRRWLAVARWGAPPTSQAELFEVARGLVGVAGLDALARVLIDELRVAGGGSFRA